MTAMWAQAEDPHNAVGDLSSVTRHPGFPDRDFLAQRYAAATGRPIEALLWYQVLAIWKAAIFLEGGYRRFQDGTAADAYFARLAESVKTLGRMAAERAGLSHTDC